MRVLTVVGNRPQFVKAAAVSQPLRAVADEVLVHTGQHHDDELSRIFFSELDVPEPDRQLAIAGGSNTSQTARMLAALEPIVAEARPDVVLVYGDTNSTLAGGLVAAQARVPVAHVEAGMRSFDRSMPEELNRVLTDHLSDLLLVPGAAAAANLAAEHVSGRVVDTGDVMVDVALAVQPIARERSGALAEHGVEPGAYVLVTAHRAGNVDDPARLARLVDVLAALPLPAVFPVHPRTRTRLEVAGLWEGVAALPGLRLTPPLGYLDFTALLCSARALVTDSGGAQKEAFVARVPCVTLRDRTEWVETVQAGWNVLADLDPGAVAAALETSPPDQRPSPYGEGNAAAHVVDALTLHAR